jgi:tRNA-2-methylthio-N6-dimethylallyladenosine synthase
MKSYYSQIVLVVAVLVLFSHVQSFVQRLSHPGIIPLSKYRISQLYDAVKSVDSPSATSTSSSSTTEFDIPTLKNIKYRINQIVDPSKIAAIKLRHIMVATKEVADECKSLITSNQASFESLAQSLSMCEMTRSHGGESGWISLDKLASDASAVEDSQSIVPVEIINSAIYQNKGDIFIIKSRRKSLGKVTEDDNFIDAWHVVQVIDIETKLSPSLIKKKRDNFLAVKGSTSITSTVEGDQEKLLTYYMETMGCQMNVADSERMQAQLSYLGYKPSNDSSSANILVLNTCSVRDHAEQKVYSYIGPYAARKRRGDDLAIIVAGCVAQQEGETLARRFPEVDIIMGPQYANRLGELLTHVADGGDQVVATEPIYQMEDNVLSQRSSDIVAFVNVIYGCNERCTFCVVPTTRGVEQSRTKEAIVEEIQGLVQQGYREVTLLGQNIDAWGRDMNPKQKFADLLAAVGEVEGLDRIRFLTNHPRYMTERVIEVVANNKKFMPCFNIPFQSGDDEVLKNMRRGYTQQRYLEIVKSIRKHVPHAAITADVIVGFPGETEEQFQNTLQLMEAVKFDQVYFRAYSPRPNTPAGDWPSQLSEEVKQDRLQRVKRMENTHAYEQCKRFIGTTQEVLVEDVNMKNPSQVMGRNPHSKLVYFEGNISELRGKMVMVEITAAKIHTLTGKLVQ